MKPVSGVLRESFPVVKEYVLRSPSFCFRNVRNVQKAAKGSRLNS